MSLSVGRLPPRRTHSDASTSIDCAISASWGNTPIRAWNRIALSVTTSVPRTAAAELRPGPFVDERSLAIECLAQTACELQDILRTTLGRTDQCAADHDSISQLSNTARLIRGGDSKSDANRQLCCRSQTF